MQTPLPWTADDAYIHGPDGHRFIAVSRPEDVTRIVRAVNNHDALVAALKAAEAALYEHRLTGYMTGWDLVLRQARTALADAEKP